MEDEKFLMGKLAWALKYKPETPEEAFDLLYEQFAAQTELMLKMVDSKINRPYKAGGGRV